MQVVLAPLVNVYQAQLEASRRFADAIFSGTEKFDRVMLGTMHHMVNEQISLYQEMSQASDPQSAAGVLQSRLLSRGPGDTINRQQEVMRIFTEMQGEISRTFQDCVGKLGGSASSATSEIAQAQPNEAFYNPVTSMFSVWESAFKEAAALAQKNMAGAREAIESAASRAMDTASAARARTEEAAAATLASTSSALHGPDDRRGKRK